MSAGRRGLGAAGAGFRPPGTRRSDGAGRRVCGPCRRRANGRRRCGRRGRPPPARRRARHSRRRPPQQGRIPLLAVRAPAPLPGRTCGAGRCRPVDQGGVRHRGDDGVDASALR
ncbi:hypothetical protein FH965_02945 [Streptomyces spectabilis]|uniref:Uncharacterized protein n=1 Tax=Streptomyces spectabilis TaxID=68270 RepID=A0A516R1Z0_STRST|nr:hypothetical protein FH965_02945 [Streptomyces spectabilis]